MYRGIFYKIICRPGTALQNVSDAIPQEKEYSAENN